MELKSIEYIEKNIPTDFNSETISKMLDDLKNLAFEDFSSENRKIGKYLLYLRYPSYKDIITENPKSLDLNVFTLASINERIIKEGYGYIFGGRWSKINGNY